MPKWTVEFKVGLFTLGAFGVLAYIFFVLSPDFFSHKRNKLYYTILPDAGGIVLKTHVKTNGVSVGKVRTIELQVNQTRVEIEVAPDVSIPVGSQIAIREKGLLGDVFVEIIRTDDKGAYIKAGDFIPPVPDQMGLSKLISMAGSIGRDIKKITSSLSEALGTEGGAQKLAHIVDDVHAISSGLRMILSDNRTKINDIVDNVRTVTKDLKEILKPENKAKLNHILSSFEETMRNVKMISEKIDQGQGTLGRLINDPKLIEDFQETVGDVKELLSTASKLEVGVDYHGELRQENVTQHYFNLRLQTRPDKYFLIGLTDTAEKIEETNREDLTPKTSADGSNAHRYRETTYTRNALRFNLQYARRWQFAQVRFGLFESTGGIATDLFLFNDRLKYTLEAFDWRKSPFRRTAHIKTYLSILLSKHIYGMAGVDDLTRLDYETGKTNKKPNYFVAGGVSFTDQDLKAMFSAATLAR